MNTPASAAGRAGATVPLVVVMGVSGSGKTVVGRALSQRLQVPFADADDFHGPANIAKMSAGIPLDDADRMPWLRAIGAWLAERPATGGVVGCSALKRAYRDVLRASAPHVTFLHLHGDPEVVRRRVAGRADHFMPASLVASQFQTLEPLQPGENGIVLDLSRPVGDLVDAFVAASSAPPSTRPPAPHPPSGTDSGIPAPPGE